MESMSSRQWASELTVWGPGCTIARQHALQLRLSDFGSCTVHIEGKSGGTIRYTINTLRGIQCEEIDGHSENTHEYPEMVFLDFTLCRLTPCTFCLAENFELLFTVTSFCNYSPPSVSHDKTA